MRQHIVIVEPCSSGLDLVRKAREMNLDLTIVSHNRDDRSLPQVIVDMADRLIEVDTNDLDSVHAKLQELQVAHPIDALVPGFEYFVATCAEVATRLGIHGHDPKAAQAVRLKQVMREHLKNAGIRVPKFVVFDQKADLRAVWLQVGSPAVLKPSDMSGSMGVRKVETEAEFASLAKAMWNAPMADLGRTQSGVLLLEEYVSGPEYSVEGHVQPDGTILFLSITEKILGAEPYFVELGHIVGTVMDPAKESRIHDYITAVIRALPLRFGPFHAELRYSDKAGPILMEVGARLAGDRIAELIKLATGFDLAESMIRAYLGEPMMWAPPSRSDRKTSGIVFFGNPGLQRLCEIQGIEIIRALPGFKTFHLNYSIGDVLPPCEDFLGRIGFAVFCSGDYHDVKNSLIAARTAFQVS